MLLLFAKWIVIVFGFFLIFAGFLMLFNPKKARETIGKAGSTNLINYGEITIRIIVSVALILYADACRYPELFQVLGWFMFVTSLILYCVPPKTHHAFSSKAADILKPIYLRLLFPFALFFGGFILYCVF